MLTLEFLLGSYKADLHICLIRHTWYGFFGGQWYVRKTVQVCPSQSLPWHKGSSVTFKNHLANFRKRQLLGGIVSFIQNMSRSIWEKTIN